jgi:hypothetical protein
MRLRLLLAVWMVFRSLGAAEDPPKPYVRFFNDSAKAATFYVDGQFGCSVPADPEENNAYCDAEISSGKHALSVKGAKLSSQSCDLFVGGGGAEANSTTIKNVPVSLRVATGFCAVEVPPQQPDKPIDSKEQHKAEQDR